MDFIKKINELYQEYIPLFDYCEVEHYNDVDILKISYNKEVRFVDITYDKESRIAESLVTAIFDPENCMDLIDYDEYVLIKGVFIDL